MPLGFYNLIYYACFQLLGMARTNIVYNLTGSSDFATLGRDFTWSCGMFLPEGQSLTVITFLRNGLRCGIVGEIDQNCTILHPNPNYTYGCLSKTTYTLTVPAESMTEYELNSVWRCKYFALDVGSPNVTLNIEIPVTTVTLTPTLIIFTAGQKMKLTCTSSASNPQTNITWYKSSVDITIQSTFTTQHHGGLTRTISSLQSIVGKEDNGKQLYCSASNTPNKTVTSIVKTLNVMYKPEIISSPSNPYSVREEETATLICTVTDANPNTNISWRWIKADRPNYILHNGPTYTIANITRGRSGTYNCTASNIVGTSEAARVNVNVQYKPGVSSTPSSPYIVREGETASLICMVTAANPYTDITWKWIKTDSPNTVLHNGHNYTITDIQRGRSGTYNCTASNTVGTSEADTIDVDVQYKPEVRLGTWSPYTVRKGDTVNLECTVTDANPNTGITWRWIKTDSPNTVLHNGSYYTILKIQRRRSGLYSCTAINSVGTSDPATVYLDVQYEPFIEEGNVTIVNENERVVLTRGISSNPLSNVSWYDGAHLLKSEFSVSTTSFIIEKVNCTYTKNFTLIASNALQWNVTSLVELIVNCRPISDMRNITLWVSDGVNLAFSTKIIAFPKPRYALIFENGMQINGIGDSMAVNSENNFTLYFYKTTVNQIDYGTYYLHINNTFGETTVYVNVLPQRKPSIPLISETSCKVRSAQIQWRSSFNGGVIQTFIALAILAQQEVSRSESLCDKGESKFHNTQLQNLQPSTKYAFYIVAQNKHGNSSSEKIKCRTLDDETSNQTPVIAGSTLGSLGLVALIVVTMFLLQKRYRCIIKLEKRTRGKESSKTEKASHYTTITEQENTERSLYDELTQNQDQYESVIMKDREGDDVKMYEQLEKTENTDKELSVDATKNDNRATGSITPLHDQPSQGTTSEYIEYTNTSLTE